jgi:hypothetical protein
MKTLGSLTLLSLALMTGCAASAPPAKAPRVAEADEEEDRVAVPYFAGTPGEMEMNWTPPPPPPEKEVKARHEPQPQWVSTKKRSLFVLPSYEK